MSAAALEDLDFDVDEDAARLCEPCAEFDRSELAFWEITLRGDSCHIHPGCVKTWAVCDRCLTGIRQVISEDAFQGLRLIRVVPITS